MLVLARRPEEVITMNLGGVKVSVKVLRFEGNQVVLGFDAPQSVAIWRDEVPIQVVPPAEDDDQDYPAMGIGANLTDVEHEISEALQAVKRDNRTAQPEGAD